MACIRRAQAAGLAGRGGRTGASSAAKVAVEKVLPARLPSCRFCVRSARMASMSCTDEACGPQGPHTLWGARHPHPARAAWSRGTDISSSSSSGGAAVLPTASTSAAYSSFAGMSLRH